jgi:hypothetical protein
MSGPSNIKIQKTGANGLAYSKDHCPLLILSVMLTKNLVAASEQS